MDCQGIFILMAVICIALVNSKTAIDKTKDTDIAESRGHGHFYAIFVHIAYSVVSAFFIIKIALGIAFLWTLSGAFYVFKGAKKFLRENDVYAYSHDHHHDYYHDHDYHHDFHRDYDHDFKGYRKTYDSKYQNLKSHLSPGASTYGDHLYGRSGSPAGYSTIYEMKNGKLSPYKSYFNSRQVHSRKKREGNGILINRLRRSSEECEKKHLCKMHARAGSNIFSSFQLYFVKKEQAQMWDHVNGRTVEDCERIYAGCSGADAPSTNDEIQHISSSNNKNQINNKKTLVDYNDSGYDEY